MGTALERSRGKTVVILPKHFYGNPVKLILVLVTGNIELKSIITKDGQTKISKHFEIGFKKNIGIINLCLDLWSFP